MKKLTLLALAIVTIALAPGAFAGTEMYSDNSAPAPSYNYAPRPRVVPEVVYYVAPPPPIVVYPRYAYYRPRFRSYGYHRFYSRGGHWHGGRHFR